MIKSYQKKLSSLAFIGLLGSCAASIDEPPALISTPEVEYKTKKVEGISLPMFLGFNMIQFSTALHGYMSGDYILMWGYTLSFITCGFVIIIILFYRQK